MLIKGAEELFKGRMVFLKELKAVDQKSGVHLSAPELKTVLEALSEKDETAEICRDAKGNPAADSDLRDTENVPIKEKIDEYFKREVLPHVQRLMRGEHVEDIFKGDT